MKTVGRRKAPSAAVKKIVVEIDPIQIEIGSAWLSRRGGTREQQHAERSGLGPHVAERAERGKGPRDVRLRPAGYGGQPSRGLPTEARASERRLERETGFEPATSTLARSHSTTELFPLDRRNLSVPYRSLPKQEGLVCTRGPNDSTDSPLDRRHVPGLAGHGRRAPSSKRRPPHRRHHLARGQRAHLQNPRRGAEDSLGRR